MPDLNSGALAPVADEVEVGAPRVTGEIPRALNGTLIRNGPNPVDGHFAGSGVLHWWPEAAMLHAIGFADGRVTVYRNRWVRTQHWAAATGAAHPEQFLASNPNINVICHSGKLLALAEGGPPAAIDEHLRTLGLASSHPAVAPGMTAHPKLDMQTGELIAFRQDWAPPYLRYWVLDRQGRTILDQMIDMSSPAMMHDMAITKTWSIFFDLSVSIDFKLLEQGYRIPIRWHDDRPARIGIIPRHGGSIRWIDIEPCFIQHVVNAFDQPDGSIVLDVARYPWYFKFDHRAGQFEQNPLASLWRYRIEPDAGRVTAQAMGGSHIELPRINESLTGLPYRYCYAVEQPTDQEMRGIVKFDLHTGGRQRHRVSPGDQNSEAVFAPNPMGVDEDEGWLLVCVYRSDTDTSEIRILDAGDLTASPVAIVHLPRRIPAGFHGAWIAA